MRRAERQYTTDMKYETKFVGKVCLVTGATSGIGKSVALKLLEAGAIVIMTGRTIVKLEKIIKEFALVFQNKGREFPLDRILYKNVDFNDPANVEKDFQNIMLKFQGKLDVLINAAGVVNRKSIKEASLVDWDKTMTVNVRGSFQMLSMSIPFLKDSKGVVVNVSATAGETPEVGGLLFSVSKSMVNMLTKCSALELAGFGIRVNAVAPLFVETAARKTPGEVSMNLTAPEYDELKRKTEDAIPLDVTHEDKLLNPEEVADTIIWLASPDSSYVTGEILTLDGGQSLTTNLYNSHLMDMKAAFAKMQDD